MKPTKPKLNVRLLRKIQKHILEEPRRFFMDGKVATGNPGKRFTELNSYGMDLSRTVPACGTAGSIMGWTAMFLGKTPRQVNNLSFRWAAEKLGLPKQMKYGWALFLYEDWPEPFTTRYENAKTSFHRARITVARIEHLIKTGE